MRIVIITVAGISSRFNRGIEENNKCLKAIYSEDNDNDTLLMHLLKKCNYADKIIVVGGYKFKELKNYAENKIAGELQRKTELVFNEYYEQLSSGYSLYMGLQKAFTYPGLSEVLFVEGDLDIDSCSLNKVINAETSVLTYNFEPIYADKAVVFYKDREEMFKYAFNREHGLLKIEDEFSLLLNSGQLWKFRDIEALRTASQIFFNTDKNATNLKIIQEYINHVQTEELSVYGMQRWTNCNTRDDYKKIKLYWEEEK